jgi:hypothetical protein
VNIKRILTTGALAAAATLVFAIFAYRVAEWSRGTPSQAVAPEPCSPTVVKVVPQVAVGSFDGGLTRYQTFVEIVNTSGMAQTITTEFFKEDGKPMDNVTLNAGTTSIAKDGVVVIHAEAEKSGTLGWGKISACSSVSVSSFFDLRDATTNVLLSRGSVAATPANMSSFVIPRVREVPTGLDVAFALVNTSATGTATLKAELRDPEGKTLATKDITMAAGTHHQFFAKDLFAPLVDPPGRSYGYVKFSSNSPTLAAIALAIEGPTLTSVPVDVLE